MSLDTPASSLQPPADQSNRGLGDESGEIEFGEFVPDEPVHSPDNGEDFAIDTSESESPSNGVAPSWFMKLVKPVESPDKPEPKKRERRKRSSNAPKIVVAPDEQRELTWKEKLVLWIMSIAAGSYGVSLLFHILVLGGASLIILNELDKNEAVSTTITETQGVDMELEEIFDTRIDAGLNDSKDSQLPQYQPLMTKQQATLMVNPAEILGSMSGDGDSEENGGSNFVFKMPSGGKVVTKGSFTAWTVPEDPEPRQEYQIIIQVTLPKNLRRYRATDLSGKVIGTDGYTQVIPYDRRKPRAAQTTRRGRLVVVKQRDYLPLNKYRLAQLAITIPGGATLIKDTIVIQSRILKEKQTLDIEF